MGRWVPGKRFAKLVQIRLSCSGLCRSPCCADPEGEVGLQFWGQILSGEFAYMCYFPPFELSFNEARI